MAKYRSKHGESNYGRKVRLQSRHITAKKGDQVKLVITAMDRDHGFKIDAFHISQKLLKRQPATVELTADQAGKFPFQCSQFCGLGHGKMKGTLVVE
jgi:cytochrome c oxidase subunit 2